MYSKLEENRSRGFTLVEVIASLAILGLVIVALLPFFPQVLGWSKATEDQLVTGNLLSQVAYDLKNETPLTNLPELDFKQTYTINNQTYTPVIRVENQTNDDERKLHLYRAQITINGKTTYVYLRGHEDE